MFNSILWVNDIHTVFLPLQISLSITSVTMDTSGFYYAIVDDTRTPPTQTPRWFVSQHSKRRG